MLDFGLVRDVADQADEASGALTGTPLYLAPETILDANAYRPESDVYALGATAYFLLTGAPPFVGANLIEVLSDHLSTMPKLPDCDDDKLVA